MPIPQPNGTGAVGALAFTSTGILSDAHGNNRKWSRRRAQWTINLTGVGLASLFPPDDPWHFKIAPLQPLGCLSLLHATVRCLGRCLVHACRGALEGLSPVPALPMRSPGLPRAALLEGSPVGVSAGGIPTVVSVLLVTGGEGVRTPPESGGGRVLYEGMSDLL